MSSQGRLVVNLPSHIMKLITPVALVCSLLLVSCFQTWLNDSRWVAIRLLFFLASGAPACLQLTNEYSFEPFHCQSFQCSF